MYEEIFYGNKIQDSEEKKQVYKISYILLTAQWNLMRIMSPKWKKWIDVESCFQSYACCAGISEKAKESRYLAYVMIISSAAVIETKRSK